MRLSGDQFARIVISAGLMSAEELKAVWGSLPENSRPRDGDGLARLLIEQERLTTFQAEELLSGGQMPLMLGDYVLLARIGAGGMGQVFKAQHRYMDRAAAIKLLPDSLTKDDVAVKRFQREVKIAAKLSHPNIVQTFDASVQRGVWYLVMEYVPGQDLASLIATEGPLTVAAALNCIRQTAQGLAYAHSQGVLHRDIKPANLLLDTSGTIKILDMGLARFHDFPGASDELTQAGQVMGTIDYMAPEQAFDIHSVSSSADIYSLGATLFRILTGKGLYEGKTITQKLAAQLTQPIPSLSALRPDVPEELEHVFERMVAKKPADRFQSMVEVVDALEGILCQEYPGAVSVASAKAVSGLGEPTLSLSPMSNDAVADLPSARLDPAVVEWATPTVSLSDALLGTDLISDCSIQAARQKTKRAADATLPARWRTLWVVIALGLGACLMSLGVWIIVRDKDGKEVARIRVPEGGQVEEVAEENTRLKVAWHGWPVGAPSPAIAPFTPTQADQYQKSWAAHLRVPVEYTNSMGMKFRFIPPGEYLRGSTLEELERLREEGKPDAIPSAYFDSLAIESPVHRVVITQPYYVGTCEVTQGQYKSVTGKSPSHFCATGAGKQKVPGDTSQHPVETVSWVEATAFCEQLNKSLASARIPAQGYRLLTEAEWEYACRAGGQSRYSVGASEADLKRQGWYGANSKGATNPVAQRAPNAFGLFDMHGNVWEWCQDGWEPLAYRALRDEIVVDPVAPPSADQKRSGRGGHWGNIAFDCRCSRRYAHEEGWLDLATGFRVAVSVEFVKQALK